MFSYRVAGTGGSVYQRALGERFALLDPGLQRYFGPPPAGCVGIGDGVYDTAGCRVAALRPVFAALATRRILFPESGRGVPFAIRNEPGPDGTLSAVRVFRFPHVVRRMEDRMAAVGDRIVDRLGRRGGLEVELVPTVSDGALRLTSRRLALRVRRLRVPLPRLAVVVVEERADPSHPERRQRVDVAIRMPVLGEVFAYRGSFEYRWEPASAGSRA